MEFGYGAIYFEDVHGARPRRPQHRKCSQDASNPRRIAEDLGAPGRIWSTVAEGWSPRRL
eukprot:12429129-Karenia_brevis.AAC.1